MPYSAAAVFLFAFLLFEREAALGFFLLRLARRRFALVLSLIHISAALNERTARARPNKKATRAMSSANRRLLMLSTSEVSCQRTPSLATRDPSGRTSNSWGFR